MEKSEVFRMSGKKVCSENGLNEAVYEPRSTVVFETVNMTHSIMPRQYS